MTDIYLYLKVNPDILNVTDDMFECILSFISSFKSNSGVPCGEFPSCIFLDCQGQVLNIICGHDYISKPSESWVRASAFCPTMKKSFDSLGNQPVGLSANS